MKKEANEQGEVQAVPLTDEAGAVISSETTFTPQAEHGSIEVSFNFNASAFEPGTELVVYEKLLCDETEIATHEDPEDENQTVRVVAPEEPPAPSNPDEPVPASETSTLEQKGTFAKTGSALVPLLVAAGIVALSGAVLVGISYRHYLRGRSITNAIARNMLGYADATLSEIPQFRSRGDPADHDRILPSAAQLLYRARCRSSHAQAR